VARSVDGIRKYDRAAQAQRVANLLARRQADTVFRVVDHPWGEGGHAILGQHRQTKSHSYVGYGERANDPEQGSQ
jgi:hypothetical protein